MNCGGPTIRSSFKNLLIQHLQAEIAEENEESKLPSPMNESSEGNDKANDSEILLS